MFYRKALLLLLLFVFFFGPAVSGAESLYSKTYEYSWVLSAGSGKITDFDYGQRWSFEFGLLSNRPISENSFLSTGLTFRVLFVEKDWIGNYTVFATTYNDVHFSDSIRVTSFNIPLYFTYATNRLNLIAGVYGGYILEVTRTETNEFNIIIDPEVTNINSLRHSRFDAGFTAGIEFNIGDFPFSAFGILYERGLVDILSDVPGRQNIETFYLYLKIPAGLPLRIEKMMK